MLGEQTESQKAEHANATHKLREALTAAESHLSSERSALQSKLDEVREAANQMLGAERSRRESAEAELARMRKEADAHREELAVAHNAMRDAQRAALSAANTAKRVARRASQEYDQRVQREHEAEGQYGKWVALEAQLRESHADALVAAENEKRLRMAAEAEARRMEESGVLAATQAEQERAAKSVALEQVRELRAALLGQSVIQATLTASLEAAEAAADELRAAARREAEALTGEVEAMRAAAEALEERHCSELASAKDEMARSSAVAAAAAAESAEASMRSQLLSAFAAEEAVRRAQSEREIARLEEEHASKLRSLAAIDGCEFAAMERALVEAGIEGAVALAQLMALEESLAVEDLPVVTAGMGEAESLEAELAATQAKSENLIQRLTRERDEARDEAIANAAAARDAAEAAKAEAEEAFREEMDAIKAEAEAARAEVEEMRASAELERDSHVGQLAISAHAVERLASEKAALEEKLAFSEEARQREVAALEGRAADDRARLERMEAETSESLGIAAEEKEALSAELDAERQRREQMQQMHEKETASLKGALHKATGYKEPKATSEKKLLSTSSSFGAKPGPAAEPSDAASFRSSASVRSASGSASPTAFRGGSPPPTSALDVGAIARATTSKTGATKSKVAKPTPA